jgi:YD repeat-containing protein
VNAADAYGNRARGKAGGNEEGLALLYWLGTANLLNLHSSRTVPGYLDVSGSTHSNATVSVWTDPAVAVPALPGDPPGYFRTSRQGEYFRAELGFDNLSGPVWAAVTNWAVLQTPITDLVTNLVGQLLVPKTAELFSYDADGNLLSDGRWNYTWDAENRLVKVESRSDTPQASWRRVEWTFDPLGRRIRQTTSVWTNNTWAVVEDLKFINDPLLFGRHIAELNATDNAVVRSYVWDLDVSGTEQGAGGVGGLLWLTSFQLPASSSTYFAAYDGNGSVAALVHAPSSMPHARYE